MFHTSRFTDPTVNASTPKTARTTKCDFQKSAEKFVARTPTSASRTIQTPKTPNSCSKTPKSSSKTPKSRTPSKYATSADRFIANRLNTDFDQAHFKLVNEAQTGNISPSKAEEERLFKENLKPGSSSSKMLSFKTKPPKCDNALNARTLYTSNITPASLKKNKDRFIAQAPERILDAPDFVNDYYLNLLDWSGSSLIAVALSQNVYIWDSKTGSIVHLCQLDSPNSYVSSLKWEKNNNYLAVGTSDSSIEVSVGANLKMVAKILLNDSKQFSAFSVLHSFHRGKNPSSFGMSKGRRDSVSCKAMYQELARYHGKHIYCQGHSYLNQLVTANLLRSSMHFVFEHFFQYEEMIIALSWYDNIHHFTCREHGAEKYYQALVDYAGCRSGAIHHHDVRIAQHQVGSLLKHTQEVCGLEWSPDGKHLASGGNDNIVNIWSSNIQRSTEPLHTLSQHTAGVKALSWCPWQCSLLASGGGSADRCIRFWNVNTGECLNSVDTKSQVCGLAWSKRYKEIVSGHGYSQNQLTVWKYPTMKRVADLTGHTGRILQLTMSPDETFVMSAAADETLRLWKLFPPIENSKQKSALQKDSLSVFKFR